MNNTNAVVVYDLKQGKQAVRRVSTRGRVTAKRVTVGDRVWDRATGKRVSAYNAAISAAVLVGYLVDGGEFTPMHPAFSPAMEAALREVHQMVTPWELEAAIAEVARRRGFTEQEVRKAWDLRK